MIWTGSARLVYAWEAGATGTSRRPQNPDEKGTEFGAVGPGSAERVRVSHRLVAFDTECLGMGGD